MQFTIHSLLRASILMISALAFVACSPSLNWREVRNADASYTVLLPAKPASHTRTVTLGELKVEMEMTAAEAEDINFAVASALVDDEGQRKNALGLMQQAMVKNIGGSVSREKTLMLKDGTAATEIEASGSMANGRRVKLYARFAMKAQRIYQAVAIGPQDRLNAEIAETFLASFTLQ